MRQRGYWKTGAGKAILDDLEAGRVTIVEAASRARASEKHVRDALWRQRHVDYKRGPSPTPTIPGLGKLADLADLGARLLGGVVEERLHELERRLEECQRENLQLKAGHELATGKLADVEKSYRRLQASLEKRALRRAGGVSGD